MFFDDLMRVWAAGERGTDMVPRRTLPPPHLCDRRFRYVCECGLSWYIKGDAVLRDGVWRAPVRACLQCHATPEGALSEERTHLGGPAPA